MVEERKMAPDIPLGADEELLFGIRIIRRRDSSIRVWGLPFGAYGGVLVGDTVAQVLRDAAECYENIPEHTDG